MTLALWIGFGVLVLVMLAVDLGVFQRKSHEVSIREALVWSAVWIGLALIFNGVIYHYQGHEAGLKFLTGYLIEKSLSVDNLFVFLLIFSYFRIPAAYQHKILYWGIIGALVFRAIFIGLGVALIHTFEWILYVFGAILVISGVKLWQEKDKEVHPESNPVLKLFKRFFAVTPRIEGEKFFIKENGKKLATPLFVALIVIETTDVIFAVDSIPAILAITTDPFLVYSSNVFAILGLRALYFALAGLMRLFHHLHYGLSAILILVGVKMLAHDFYKMPIGLALGAIVGILALSIAASLIWPVKEKEIPPTDPVNPVDKKIV